MVKKHLAWEMAMKVSNSVQIVIVMQPVTIQH